jgi:hypothetical protein
MKHYHIKTFFAILLCLAIAYVIMFGLGSPSRFINHITLNLGLGIGALFLSAYFIADRMNYHINSKHRSSILVGQLGSFTILICGILVGSTVGFVDEGIDSFNKLSNVGRAMLDYYLKPMYWILLFGAIPTIFFGTILGLSIRRKRVSKT